MIIRLREERVKKAFFLQKSFKKVIKTFFRFFLTKKETKAHIGMILKHYLVQKSLNGTLVAKNNS